MIVNYLETGWEVITQRAHGALASQLAFHWKLEERPARWVETLLAIAEHDDAEVELGGENLLTAAGGPLNFTMKQFDLQHCKALSLLTITKSRYIALLVSIHMDFLYHKEEKGNKEVHAFLQEQRILQAQWRKELGLSKEETEKTYHLLEWCDAFSLILCQRQLQPEKRSMEISKGPDGKMYTVSQDEEGMLQVSPWPFEVQSFTVSFESRVLHQLQFDDSSALRQAFIEASVTDNLFTIAKANTASPANKSGKAHKKKG
jgi:hypothetical protein